MASGKRDQTYLVTDLKPLWPLNAPGYRREQYYLAKGASAPKRTSARRTPERLRRERSLHVIARETRAGNTVA